MNGIPIYWRTRFGSLVERQAGPDRDGWMTVRRLSDDAVRDWNIREMTPVSNEEALREARGELAL